MHTDKYNKGDGARILGHVTRSRETVTESKIDPSKTHLNQDLVPPPSPEQYKQYCKLAKRKDAVMIVSTVLTLPDELKYASRTTQMKFFQVASDALHKHIGGVLAWSTVHFDETTPHLHHAIVPITPDGRLCAKEICTRKMLKTLHPEITKAVQKAGFNVTLYEQDEQLKQIKHDLGMSKQSMHQYRKKEYHSQVLQEASQTVDEYLRLMQSDLKHSARPVKRQKGESRQEYKQRKKDYVEVRRDEYEALRAFVMQYDTIPDAQRTKTARIEAERINDSIAQEYENFQCFIRDQKEIFSKSVEERAQSITRKRIAELLQGEPSSKMERAENFMREIKCNDGLTVWDHFQNQEREFRKKLERQQGRDRC